MFGNVLRLVPEDAGKDDRNDEGKDEPRISAFSERGHEKMSRGLAERIESRSFAGELTEEQIGHEAALGEYEMVRSVGTASTRAF